MKSEMLMPWLGDLAADGLVRPAADCGECLLRSPLLECNFVM